MLISTLSSMSVSISTAVCKVMCKQPAIRGLPSGFLGLYTRCIIINPGISFPVSSIILMIVVIVNNSLHPRFPYVNEGTHNLLFFLNLLIYFLTIFLKTRWPNLYYWSNFTSRKWSCVKVMFLHPPFCSWGCIPACNGQGCPEGTPPCRLTPPGHTPLGRHPSGRHTLFRQTHPV